MNEERIDRRPVLPDTAKVPVSGAESAASFKSEWAKLKGGKEGTYTSVPGTGRNVRMSKVEASDNVLSIWISDDTSGSPDFVIVNPPSDNAMTTIATVIDGAAQ